MASPWRIPWGTHPTVEWDEENEEHASRHGVAPWEVEEMITQGDFECIRHPKWQREANTQGDIFCEVAHWVVDFSLWLWSVSGLSDFGP